jgi:hypothetical protein
VEHATLSLAAAASVASIASLVARLRFCACSKGTPGFWPLLNTSQVREFFVRDLGCQLVSALVLFSSSVGWYGESFSYRFLLSSLLVVLQLDLFTGLVLEPLDQMLEFS